MKKLIYLFLTMLVLACSSDDGGQEVPHLHFHLFGGEKVGKMVE